MPIYKIRGIDVDFPFEAYDCQLVYMEKVIQSLQELKDYGYWVDLILLDVLYALVKCRN
ncbi:hypothetical protein CK203_105054 [Vitis vinifera]|uniref:Uncharacterized protein n=1 Tax=Vitis vinifera TaxID=29760 RepID=A0A438FEE0_VITVI|nr:hypothetical protein CK203_105054 [Vitis vinifera]